MKTLDLLGWNNFFEERFKSYKASGFQTGRISIEQKERYLVFTEYGELPGEISGKFLYTAESSSDFPKVGDWVVVSIFKEEAKVIIHDILPRKNKFSRKFPDKKIEEQVLAANVDIIFIVQSLDYDYNIRRLERYVTMVNESKAEPVILLNKSDLVFDVMKNLNEVHKSFPEIKCFVLSSIKNIGLEKVMEIIQPGITSAFIGSSGVGKSTIINRLARKEILKTQVVREKDSKGKHTTTFRQLIPLENAGMVIDTPGMRELQLWNADAGLEETFNEIDLYAKDCHFSDCTHTTETNCTVTNAIKEGKIPEDRYKSYLKLQKELRYLETKIDKFSYLEFKKKQKAIHKAAKDFFKRKNI